MSQILTIAWVRVRLLINALRHRTSGWAKFAGGLSLLAGLLLSLALATMVTALAHSIAGDDGPESVHKALLVCFWACALLGLLMPVLLSTGTSGLDTSRLSMFPIRRRRLFFVTWGSAFLSTDHLFYLPMLIGVFSVLLVLGYSGGLAGAMTYWLLPIVVVTWSMGLLELLQGVMRHRRGKEIAGMAGFGLFLVVAMLPSLMTDNFADDNMTMLEEGDVVPGALEAQLELIASVASVTPPGLAADAVVSFSAGRLQAALLQLGGLLAWCLCGLGFSYIVFRWRRSNDSVRAQSGGGSRKTTAGRFDATALLPFIGADVVAVASKELRYVFRSSVGKLNILIVPVVCAFLLTALGRASDLTGGIAPPGADRFLLFGLMIYGLLFTNNFANNSVGWEGSGFKVYLLAPVPFQRVLIGKNLGIWVYSALLYSLILVTWSVLRSPPDMELLLTSAGLFAGSILLFTASGNFASLAFPVKRDISAMKSQPSQPALLLSLLTVLCLAVVLTSLMAMAVVFPAYLGMLGATGLFLLGSAVVYRLSLPHAEALFLRKRDEILAKAEGAS